MSPGGAGVSPAKARVDLSDEYDGPPVPETLTAKQTARRQNVLRAAWELAEEGGYDAVQMRDVAARADVALGTVYRYFSSKDQLLAAVWADWTAALERRLAGQPLEGCTRADRVVDFLRRAMRPLERRRKLAGALVTSVTSTDPHAAVYQREIASWMTRMMVDPLEGLPAAEQNGIREVLGHVWYSVLLSWSKERMTTEHVHEVLATTCHLLLDPRERESEATELRPHSGRRRGAASIEDA